MYSDEFIEAVCVGASLEMQEVIRRTFNLDECPSPDAPCYCRSCRSYGEPDGADR